MPIEAWEVGLFDVDETKSEAVLSEEVTKTVSQLLAYGVARVLWLPLAADPNGTGGEEKRFGLLEPDGTPRPVADAFRQLVRISSGATLQPLDAQGLLGLVARQGDKATVVAWATDGPVAADWADGAVERARRHHHDGLRRHRHRHQPGDDRGAGAAGGRAGWGPRMTGPELLDGKTGMRRVAFEVRRHARWAREEGFGKLVEEDQLNVFERAPVAARKLWWRSTHGVAVGSVDAGVPVRCAAFGHQHGGAGAGALARVRGPQRERPPGLRALRAAQHVHRAAGGRAEPRPVHPLQAPVRQPPCRSSCWTRSAPPCRPGPSGPTGGWRAGSARPCRSSATTTSPCWPTSPLVVRWIAGRRRASALTPWSSSAASIGSRSARPRPRPCSGTCGTGSCSTCELNDRPDLVVVSYRDLVKRAAGGLRARGQPARPALHRRPHRPHRRPRGLRRPRRSRSTSIPGCAPLCRDLEDRLDAVARSHQQRAVPVRPLASPTAGPMEPRPRGPQNRGAA